MDNRIVTAERKSGMSPSKIKRRYPIGAELISEGRVHFRVWAPKADRLEVAIDDASHELQREPDGYFSGAVEAKAGTLYRFRYTFWMLLIILGVRGLRDMVRMRARKSSNSTSERMVRR